MKVRMCRGSKLCLLAVLCVLLLTSAFAIESFALGSDMGNLPPLYLTIVVHEFWLRKPDFRDCAVMVAPRLPAARCLLLPRKQEKQQEHADTQRNDDVIPGQAGLVEAGKGRGATARDAVQDGGAYIEFLGP